MDKHSPLIISVAPLLRSEIGAGEEVDLTVENPQLEDLPAVGELTLGAELSKINEEMLALSGKTSLTIELQCDRCTKTFPHELRARLNEIFTFKPETEEWPISRRGEIDLSEPIRQELLLRIPTHPLCAEDCPGLCQVCGKDPRVCTHEQIHGTLETNMRIRRNH